MAHLNYFHTRVAFVNFCFFIAIPSGGGCWYYAWWSVLVLCEMQDAATQNRWWNEHSKLWIFCVIVKWRWWRHAAQLTATTVATDSCCRFSKTWHVADIKNIVWDDQATLMVDWNSANIVYTVWFYVCLHLRDRDCCSAADGNGTIATDSHCHFSKTWHVADFKTSPEMTRQP